ncbi:MAG: hypothetical protein Q4D76_14810 [Oscillospiraceae bacterium]|nr:hypothetical protein [Oscillospiraceae bacterium]
MKKYTTLIFTLITAMLSFTSCGTQNMTEDLPLSETTPDIIVSETITAAESGQVTAPSQEVGYEGMEAVYAESIKDGIYSITVDSSSPMFNITECELKVENGKMTAVITMGGTGYAYIFMGTSDEAENAAEDEYIEYSEDDTGKHSFTVPVEVLNKKISCAAFSKKKELWYDRLLVFRADSLPVDAYTSGTVKTATDLGLEDGQYTADVILSGGSGRASVLSPALITVTEGKVTAKIIWNSRNYDYMIVDGEKYLPLESEENSAFEIPVASFDFDLPVSADTTAMSTPHEIEYTLRFNSSGIAKK